jgi:hypothetical protein
MGNAKRDNNYVPVMLGVESSDATATTPVNIDPATGRLLVTAVVTAGATTATEYTEGDTDATFTGIMLLGEGPANTATPFAVDASGLQVVTQNPTTSGGLTIFRSIDLDETEEEVKASAGQVYSMWVTNTATSTRFLKFYNATAANVTVGTTTPVITWGIPGNSSDDISAVFGGGHGIAFGTAITVAATTGVADADTGAPGANEVICNIFFK